MDLPQPPKDTDLKNIIDKLAQFVARNGPEFEQMTKSKQKNNPKFVFLYGGEHFNYYQYKVTTEQAILKQSTGRQDVDFVTPPPGQYNIARGLPAPGMDILAGPHDQINSPQWPKRQILSDRPPGLPPVSFNTSSIDNIVAQQATLQEQIKQSEDNLNAQHSVLIQQQQSQMEETVANAQSEMIKKLAAECNINLTEFDGILQPIIDSCTKDSISTGKGWILNHSTSHDAGMLIAQYLLKKVTTSGANFTQKLHIIYLINDVLHHCARKNADDLKRSLETVVVPMFCNASIAITEEQETKLNKLLKLWESKSNYFEQSVIEKMKDPTNSYQEYTANLISQYGNLITPLTQQTKIMLQNYQKQHQAFVNHTLVQIQQLDIQKQMYEQQMNMVQMGPEHSNIIQQNSMQHNFPVPPFNDQVFNHQQPNIISVNPVPPFEPPGFCNTNAPIFNQTGQNQMQGSYGHSNGMQINNAGDTSLYDFDSNYNQNSNSNSGIDREDNMNKIPHVNLSQPPPGFFDSNIAPVAFVNGLPDLSKPPPGFATIPEVCPDELVPSVPYYELPAGLMVPLIMLEDTEYKPLDPDAIKLPIPAPPSDRLLAAVKAFYASPVYTRPRDRTWTNEENTRGENNKENLQITSEGWEKLGLYEYYQAKSSACKQKEEDIKSGVRQRSKSPSPILLEYFPIRSLPVRRYRSKSRSPSKERENSRSKSPTPRARSISPDKDTGGGNRRGNYRGHRSPNISPSQSPVHSFNRKGSPDSEDRNTVEEYHSSRNDRSSNRSEQSNSGTVTELDSTNKGHQMLRKMGWTQGAGLGATGQGITAPVSASKNKDPGRDINMSDPYVNFRKKKKAAFITRMKERALERSS